MIQAQVSLMCVSIPWSNTQYTNKKMNLKQQAISIFAIQAFQFIVGIRNKKDF